MMVHVLWLVHIVLVTSVSCWKYSMGGDPVVVSTPLEGSTVLCCTPPAGATATPAGCCHYVSHYTYPRYTYDTMCSGFITSLMDGSHYHVSGGSLVSLLCIVLLVPYYWS